MKSNIATIWVFIAFVLALAVSPTPVSAFSFSSLFGGGDSNAEGNSTVGQEEKTASGSEGADMSDGTDIKPRQPLLDPEAWFLTEQEITDSRGGIPRDDMSVYTTGNKVTSYTAANEFYDAVYDDLSATKEGDRIFLAAWLAALVPLKPDVDPTGAKTGVKEVFAGVVERGGHVNILNWANIGCQGGIDFDDRLPKALATHHQKNMVIAANSSSDPDDQPVAYVGGLDLANDRWDTISHNNTAIRDKAKITFRQKGWMDGHLRIHGPAAKDVANNFLARWNSKYLPCQGLDDDLLRFKNPEYDSLPALDYASSNTTASLGKQSVQITRTFSCLYKHYKEFAPRGETSLFQARIKAIKNAKNFIYIEDQYFILVPELLDAIMEVMPKIQRLVVVANPQTSPFTNAGYIKYFYESVEPIRSKYPNKFKIYTLKAPLGILIHTKLVIIDDVYLSIGSANWNRRSMTSDSELNTDVVDGETVKSPEGVTVGKLPRNFRIRKFQEMTGLSYKKLDAMTFIEAADQLPITVADESSIMDNNNIQHKAYFFAITNAMRKMSDPQDTCTYTST
ncbi:hypothetical protein PF008_g28586 [Phytophthora fragariae]|uniref:phospholipase D n=1 Tax=Phytophthora fragariae TaxID=53985 RepID=A0A6G0QAV1_9STRA|nr:hypothetical protein PF008_g28586 [Phytophthora fragariae]